jgi:hypothetical protein
MKVFVKMFYIFCNTLFIVTKPLMQVKRRGFSALDWYLSIYNVSFFIAVASFTSTDNRKEKSSLNNAYIGYPSKAIF